MEKKSWEKIRNFANIAQIASAFLAAITLIVIVWPNFIPQVILSSQFLRFIATFVSLILSLTFIIITIKRQFINFNVNFFYSIIACSLFFMLLGTWIAKPHLPATDTTIEITSPVLPETINVEIGGKPGSDGKYHVAGSIKNIKLSSDMHFYLLTSDNYHPDTWWIYDIVPDKSNGRWIVEASAGDPKIGKQVHLIAVVTNNKYTDNKRQRTVNSPSQLNPIVLSNRVVTTISALFKKA